MKLDRKISAMRQPTWCKPWALGNRKLEFKHKSVSLGLLHYSKFDIKSLEEYFYRAPHAVELLIIGRAEWTSITRWRPARFKEINIKTRNFYLTTARVSALPTTNFALTIYSPPSRGKTATPDRQEYKLCTAGSQTEHDQIKKLCAARNKIGLFYLFGDSCSIRSKILRVFS